MINIFQNIKSNILDSEVSKLKKWHIGFGIKLFLYAFALASASIYGQVWQNLNIDNILDIEFHPDSTNVMFLTGASGGVFRSYDLGESVDTLISDIIAYDLTFNPSSPDTLFLACGSSVGHQAGILKLIQVNGLFEYFWSDSGIDLSNDALVNAVKIMPGSPDIMFASTSTQLSGNFYRSENGGRNWNPINLPVAGRVNFVELDQHNFGTLYCGSSANVLFKSIDFGDNWIALDYGATTEWYPKALDINPNDGSMLYLSSQADGLFKSSDAGDNWTQISSLPHNSSTSFLIDPNNTSNIYVISPFGIFRSNDAGLNWNNYTFNLTGFGSPIRSLFIDSDSRYLYVTPDYLAIYRLDLSTVAINEANESLPDLFSIHAFPNPTNGQVSIVLTSAIKSSVGIKIWDLTGKLVQSYEPSELAIGENIWVWNGRNLEGLTCSAGVYLVTTTNDFSQFVQKITLLN